MGPSDDDNAGHRSFAREMARMARRRRAARPGGLRRDRRNADPGSRSGPLRLSRAADHSSSRWVRRALALAGGPAGRRAAASGLASLGVTSLFVNAALKLAGEAPAPGSSRARRPRVATGADARSRARFPRGTARRRSRSRPGSATCSRAPRSRCVPSRWRSPTRGSTGRPLSRRRDRRGARGRYAR